MQQQIRKQRQITKRAVEEVELSVPRESLSTDVLTDAAELVAEIDALIQEA